MCQIYNSNVQYYWLVYLLLQKTFRFIWVVDAFGIHKIYFLFYVLAGFAENIHVLKCKNTQKQKNN